MLAELRDALAAARSLLRDCDPNLCNCDDKEEEGGLGIARRAEWCGGPCVMRETIDRLLGTRGVE